MADRKVSSFVEDTTLPGDAQIPFISLGSVTGRNRRISQANLKTAITGQLQADLTSHVALKNAHGVTRVLYTFASATPVHIPGNLLSHDQQRGISGWNSFGGSSVHAPTGGPDGGGERTVTASSTSLFGMNSEYIACAPGDVRTYTIRFRASEAVASGDVYVSIVFLNSSFGYISSSTALPVVAAGVDFTATVTTPLGGAPAGTAWIGVQIYRFTGHTVGSTLSASVACFRTSPTIPSSIGVAPSAFAVTGGAGGVCIKLGSRGIVVTSSAADSYVDIQLGALTSGRHKIELIGTQRSGTISSNGLIVDTSVYPAGLSTICRTVTPFIDAGRGARLSTTPVEATPVAPHYGWALVCTSPTNGAELVISDIMIESYS